MFFFPFCFASFLFTLAFISNTILSFFFSLGHFVLPVLRLRYSFPFFYFLFHFLHLISFLLTLFLLWFHFTLFHIMIFRLPSLTSPPLLPCPTTFHYSF